MQKRMKRERLSSKHIAELDEEKFTGNMKINACSSCFLHTNQLELNPAGKVQLMEFNETGLMELYN